MIADKLNELYLSKAEPRNSSAEPWFPRASSIGGCLREMAHIAHGIHRFPLSPTSLRVFELGTQRGRILAACAKEIYPDAMLELEVEIPLPGIERPMLGHLDVWIPSQRTILDFKTAGAFKMGLLKSGKEGPGEDYELQIQAYRHGIVDGGFETQAPPDLANAYRDIRCLLLFEAKDSDARRDVEAGELLEIEVPHTAELEIAYQARLHELAQLVKLQQQGTLDPQIIQGMSKTHWKCKLSEDGKPRYCSIGPILGKCHS